MKFRNPDGRFRNHNQPVALTEHTLRARWLEGEVLRMKRLGFSYEAIAQQITEIGRGRRPRSLLFPKTSASRLITASLRWVAMRPLAERSSARLGLKPMSCARSIPTVVRICI